MVTGGFSNYNYAKTTEVIDLANPNIKCQNMAKLINLREGAVGGLIKQKWPLICGGYPAVDQKNCEVIGGIDEMELKLELLERRRWAASQVWIDEQLWVTGGIEGPSITSEIVNIVDGKVATSVMLPLYIGDHCLVQVTSDLFLLIGGIGGGLNEQNISDETWWFSIGTFGWSKGPKLNQARRNHACVVFKDLTTNNTVVAVVGGSNSTTSDLLDSVEVFDGKSWKYGPKLPVPLESSKMVSKEFSGVLMGGYDGSFPTSVMRELTCEFGTCFWRKMSQKLEEPRRDFVAMIIPDSLANCTNES